MGTSMTVPEHIENRMGHRGRPNNNIANKNHLNVDRKEEGL